MTDSTDNARGPEAADEITALRARLAEVERERDDLIGWRTVAESNKAMCMSWQGLASKAEARAERAEAALKEMTRRRDEWRKKAEGFDDIRQALREKVGEPWPPNMSRLVWAGIAADERKRANDAEAALATALRDAFNNGYLIACCNIYNLHNEETIAADVLREAGISAREVKAMRLSEYDATALEKIRKSRPASGDPIRALANEVEP